MLVFNGSDYTLIAVPVLSALVLFLVEYLICRKTARRWLRRLPWLYPLLLLVLAGLSLVSTPTGFLDLRELAALLLLIYAAVCAAALVLGWVVCRVRGRH